MPAPLPFQTLMCLLSPARFLCSPYIFFLSGFLSCTAFYIVYEKNYFFCEVLKSLSRIRLFVSPWTVAYQAPQSMEFSRQEYWSGLPFPSPGDLPNPGIEPRPPTLQADTLPSEPPGKPPLFHYK